MSLEILKYSLKNLWENKSRSFLTVLSIFVGITTIFIFVSFGAGLQNYVKELSESAGIDKFVVQARSMGAPGMDDTFKLEDSDLDTISKTKGVKQAVGMYFAAAKITQKKNNKYVYLLGMPDDNKDLKLGLEFMTVDVFKGRWLSKGDNKKAVLGYNFYLEEKIFSDSYDVGEKIIINDEKFEIVGFLESIGNPSDDSNVYIMEDDIKQFKPDITYAMIFGVVDDYTNINDIVDSVKKNLRKSRGLEEGKEDFFVQTYEELIDQFSAVFNVLVGFIIMIALISVFVSAINTANTMVTSVLERIKEIGVMKAIGAKNSTIRNIFLFESGILGLSSGIIGVFLGWIISSALASLLDSLGWGFLKPAFNKELFIGCILFAVIVGTVSGIIPAVQASRQNPVDALRYE